ncbi:hypothetical protein MMC34_007226 [Xylographa carneopallida]|nr:hypothetical protein [Xylographa carneopallida]
MTLNSGCSVAAVERHPDPLDRSLIISYQSSSGGTSSQEDYNLQASYLNNTHPALLYQASYNTVERVPLLAKASLLGLPLKLRLLIYKYLFCNDVYQFPTAVNLLHGDQLSEWVKDMDLRFCSVFQSTYHEALPVAFAYASFRLDGDVPSGECYYRWGERKPNPDPGETRILRSLIDHICTIHVKLKWLVSTRDGIQWHRTVPTPKLLRTVIVHVPHGRLGGIYLHTVLKSPDLCVKISATVQVLLQRGVEVHFECGGMTDLELVAWGEAFRQPGDTIPMP